MQLKGTKISPRLFPMVFKQICPWEKVLMPGTPKRSSPHHHTHPATTFSVHVHPCVCGWGDPTLFSSFRKPLKSKRLRIGKGIPRK